MKIRIAVTLVVLGLLTICNSGCDVLDVCVSSNTLKLISRSLPKSLLNN